MALPHEHCGPGEVCCASLYEVADLILEICHTAVVGCSSCDCELPGLVGYVSMGRQIEDPAADYLAVTLTSVFAAPSSADDTGNMQLPIFRANFQVKLLETGWPMPYGDGEEINIPEPELVQNAARHAYAHGEAMYRAAANALMRRELNPGCRDCYQRIEPLTPVEPSGGTTGWQFNLIVGTNFGAR
jgi:hypothetical protein